MCQSHGLIAVILYRDTDVKPAMPPFDYELFNDSGCCAVILPLLMIMLARRHPGTSLYSTP
jgi:hypothetical protein